MRNALARTLYELAKEDDRVVVLVADISPAGAMEEFRKEFPDRFINVGVAEQSMIGLAAGLAQRGFRPFAYTIATFALFRAYEFVRCDLAYQDLPVTVVGMGAGLSYSTLGGTHQAIEDVAVALACPNLTVLAPCDPTTTSECVAWCAQRRTGGPVYLRIGKAGEPDLTSTLRGLQRLGAPRRLRATSSPVHVVSYGPIAAEALKLADAIGANMSVVTQLSGWAASDPDRASWGGIGRSGGRIIVVEEASGAPLTVRLAALGTGATVKGFALSRSFPHLHGTREELLRAAGLTAEQMLDKLRAEGRVLH